VVQAGQDLLEGSVIPARLQGQDTLTDSGDHQLGGDKMADPVQPSHTAHARSGDHDTVETFLFDLADPRIQVAPQGENLHVPVEMKDLAPAPQRTRSDAGPVWQAFELETIPGHQDIPGILPLGCCGDFQTLGQDGGNVLQAVDCQIDLAPKECVFEFLDEDPFAADPDQGHVLHDIPLGLDDDQLCPDLRVFLLQTVLDPVRLHQGQGAAPRAYENGPCNDAASLSLPGRAPRPEGFIS